MMKHTGFDVVCALVCLILLITSCGCAGVTASGASDSAQQSSSNDGIEITSRILPDTSKNIDYWTSLTAVGGNKPYRWSVASGSLPEGLAINSATGIISGSANADGHFPFSLRVEDSSQAHASAMASLAIDVDLSPQTASGSTSACGSGGCYGPGIGADSLANTTVGPNGNSPAYRFRAQRSGLLKQLRVYLLPDKPGYSGGTGGKIRITLVEDDGTSDHNPSARPLASFLLTNPIEATPSKNFPLITFPAPPTLNAGQLYHLVFTNEDASPNTNYLSVDALYVQDPTVPLQKSCSDLDCAVLVRAGSGRWSHRDGQTPVMELIYQDGRSTGMGYIEAWVGSPQTISGNSSVRELFTVNGAAKKVNEVGIRIARSEGSDPLRIRLEEDDGTLIEGGNIPASQLPSNGTPTWVTYRFQSTHPLVPGTTYHLVLLAADASTYQTYPIRKGTAYGFQNSTYFADGYAQFKQGSEWVGWTQWSATNRKDGDLQFYFTLAP